MIDTLEAAKEALLKHVNAGFQKYHPDDELVIEDKFTQVKDYGWIFIVQSKKYLETNNLSYVVPGGAKIVLKDGTIEGLVSYLPVEQAIEQYEQSRESN